MNTHRLASGLSVRTRRRAALLAALSLPLSLVTTPATAQGPTPSPTSSTPQTTSSATPTDAALAQARTDNKRVEIEALRSETSTFFANPDGKTVHAELSSAPIRVKKDGAWQPIDTRLIEKGGVLQPKASLGDLTLSAGGGTDAVTYTGGKGKASVAAPVTLPKPVVKDNTATYPDVYGPGTDLVVTVTPQGFRHDVVIRQRPATDLELRVPMRLPKGLKLGKGADKTPGVLDAKGKEVEDLGSAPVLDAAAMAAPDQGRVGKASTGVDGDDLVLTTPQDFLADPTVTYPVTVAAASETWEGTGIAGDTHVSNVLPDGQANASLSYLLAGRSHSGTRTHRTYIRFNIHDTPLMGGTVKNADLRLHNYNSHTCSDTDSAGIVAHRITEPWTVGTLTWGNEPDVTIDGQVGNKGAYSATIPCPEGEGELYYSIEQMVQEWMDGEPDEGVRLKSPTETVAQNWRYYRSDEYGGYDTYPYTPRGPVLFIEYEPAPVELNEVVYLREGEPDGVLRTVEEVEANKVEITPDPSDSSPVSLSEYEAYEDADEGADEEAAEVDSSEVEPIDEEPVPTTPRPAALNANPFFETELAPWTAEGGNIERTQEQAHEHDFSAALTPSGTAENAHVRSENGIPVKANTDYTIKGWFLQPGTVAEIEYGIDWFDAGGALVSTSSSCFTPAQGDWSSSDHSYQSPASAVTAQLRVTLGSDPSADAVTYLDEILLVLTPVPDTTPPSVNSTTPAEGATGVPLSSPVTVTFSEPVANVHIAVKDPANAEVQGDTEADSRRTTYTFTPAAALSAQTAYTAEVSGAADDAGNVLTTPLTWSFTTGQETKVPRTISLPAQADGWIDSEGGHDFTSGTLYSGAYGNTDLMVHERTYLRFDTSALDGKEITSAQLEMWNTEVYGCGDAEAGLQAHRITADWSPDTLTWSNQPSASEVVTSTDPGGCREDSEAGVLWTWPVTQAVQSWASGETAYGLMVRGVDESADSLLYDRGFVSTRATGDAAHPPVLTVNYLDTEGSEPTPTPTPTPDPDSTPPTVVNVDPPDGATGVSADQHVTVTFSEPVVDAEFTLTDILDDIPVTGSVQLDEARTVLTFIPDEPLEWLYGAEIIGARDAAGNTMEPYWWSFEGDWGSPSARSTAKTAGTELKPVIAAAWAHPFATVNGATVTSTLTPQLQAKVSGPLRRNSTVEVEVKHAPDRTAQGSGLIWSAKAKVTAGTTARFQVPKGELANGWKVVWRARATASGQTGAWSEWDELTVSEAGTAVAKAAAVQADDELDFAYDHVDFQECAANARLSGALARKHGWIKNLYSWCSRRVLGVALERTVINRFGVKSKEVVGQVEFLFSVAGKTLSGGAKIIKQKPGPYAEIDRESGVNSRTIYTWARIDLPLITQDLIALGAPYYTENNVFISVNVQGTGAPSAGACKSDTPAGRRASVANWKAAPQLTTSFFSDKAAGSGPHKLGICTLTPQLRLDTPTSTGNVPTGMAKEPVRCDTSESLPMRYGGCVFRKKSAYVVHRIWGYENGAEVQNESTALIDDAFDDPDNTWPTKHDGKKVIPGEWGSGSEIHRTSNEDINMSNREDSGSWCYARWPGVDPEKQEVDCDEYPFAATLEGSSSTSGKARNVAVRYVNRSHNRSVGGALPGFFNQNRVLGSNAEGNDVPVRHNAFTVKVVN